MSSVGIFQLREIPIGDLETDGTHHIKVTVSKIQYFPYYKIGGKKHHRYDLKSSHSSNIIKII